MLTIAISTYSNRIEALSFFTFNSEVDYIILWQSPLDSHPSFPSNVKLIILDTKGVSNSRNSAILNCKTKWLWFMDDDVFIPDKSIINALKKIEKIDDDSVLITSVFDELGFPTKVYNRIECNNKTSILNVGTIQIIVNADFVKSANILFPNNMGAGSEYPACDEPVFLSRLFNAGVVNKFVFDNEIVVCHPRISSGIYIDKPSLLISRAILFKEMFGFPLCIFASLFFYIKNVKRIKLKFIYLFHFLAKSDV